MSRPQRYLILPPRGLHAQPDTASDGARRFLESLVDRKGATALQTKLRSALPALRKAARSGAPTRRGGAQAAKAAPKLELLASLNEDGVKLVSATAELIAAMRFEQPGLRIVPEVFYELAQFRPGIDQRIAAPAAANARILNVEVVRAEDGTPVRGAEVRGFTDYENLVGTDSTTNASGKARLRMPNGSPAYERLFVFHDEPGLWSHLSRNVPNNGAKRIELAKLDLTAADSLRHFHASGDMTHGTGVKVAVVDSGVARDHADLKVSGGKNCIPGETPTDFEPHGSHGTHVAGIIAGRGTAPTGMRGIAPGAELFSFRVFGPSASSGSSFAIVAAIQEAIASGCDLINLSLSFDGEDEAVRAALQKAHGAGVLVIAAAGNDGREPVSYPASDDLALAVSAVGRKATFAVGSSESGDVKSPFGADPNDFIAAFSNVGVELDLAGAGVGVVSTVPGGYAPMSGTSMACPAVTGMAARLLSQNDFVRNMARDANRSDALRKLVTDAAVSLGFGFEFEGKGLPR